MVFLFTLDFLESVGIIIYSPCNHQLNMILYCEICECSLGEYTSSYKPKTCSYKCSGELRKKNTHEQRECVQCKNMFLVKKKSSKKLCSSECRAKYVSTPEHISMRMSATKLSIEKTYGSIETHMKEVVRKGKITKMQKYNNADYVNPKKMIETKKRKYGSASYHNHAKHKNTMLSRYGADNFSKTDKWKENWFVYVMDRLPKNIIPMFSYSEYRGTKDIKYKFECSECNKIFYDRLSDGHQPTCPHHTLSTLETEIQDFLQNELKIPSIEVNNRRLLAGKELDFYLPDHNVAIEANGVYWHSELHGKSKHYHLGKTNACEQRGIRLLHIWDIEWNTKKDIVKSILQTTLSPQKNTKVFARKCVVKEISSKESSDFLRKNHIQGNCNASIRIGLFYQDVLIQLITLGKSRFTKTSQYELFRLCSSIGTTVVGGLQKLWKYFIITYSPNTVITYSDRRLFTGLVYDSLGFVPLKNSPPKYEYFLEPTKVQSRMAFQKHKLSKVLSRFDPSKTEWQNMQDNGYDRIWDCGHAKFLWTNPL